MKLELYNDVGAGNNHAKQGGAMKTWVVSANTCFGFLGTFFTLFSGLRRACTTRQILTTYTSYDVFPRQYLPFAGRVDIAPHFGSQMTPKSPFWGRE